jgi:hypothetical protein
MHSSSFYLLFLTDVTFHGVAPLKDVNGRTPVFDAVSAGAVRLVDSMIELGAQVDAKSNMETGAKGLLHLAVEV